MRKQFAAGLIAGLAVITVCAVVALATPGGDDNPLISKAYLENIFMGQVQEYVDSSTAFTVVQVKKGEELIGSSGCELILRQGKATVIATEKGGLADTTIGVDLKDGEAFPPNHLTIVPVDDGRGLSAENDVLVMVKGKYTIQ